MNKALKEAKRIIKADGRVSKDFVTYSDSEIRIATPDGFYLRITPSDSAIDGPLYFRNTGDTFFGDYADITNWIGRHFK